jgi:hypothetical protein
MLSFYSAVESIVLSSRFFTTANPAYHRDIGMPFAVSGAPIPMRAPIHKISFFEIIDRLFI